jgi:hypothetical protein
MDAFCRIEQATEAMTIRCLPWNGSGTASLADGRLHLAWGVALFRFVIDAQNVSAAAFTGTYKLKTFGDSHDAPMPAFGRKLALPGDAPGDAGQAEALRAALQAIAGGTAPPQDEARRRKFGTLFGGPPANWAASLRDAGPPLQVIFLGTGAPPRTWRDSRDPDSQPAPPGKNATGQSIIAFDVYNSFSLYDVEFANGQRLCGVHAGEDGKADNFLCV